MATFVENACLNLNSARVENHQVSILFLPQNGPASSCLQLKSWLRGANICTTAAASRGVYRGVRTSRPWRHRVPPAASRPASRIQPPPSLHFFRPPFLFLVPHGPRKRARVRSCVGMAVCLIEGVGPLGVSRELHEFVMSAMLAMAY